MTTVTRVNYDDPSQVTGLTSAKGDVITGAGATGLIRTPVGEDGAVLTANVGAAGGVLWVTANGTTYNSTLITSSRTFPTIGTEGVSTLDELDALQMWITAWGGGGGGAYTGVDGMGGGSSSAVVRIPVDLTPAFLFGETLTVTIGAGGAGGLSADGTDGSNTTVVSTDATTIIDITSYGGGGADITVGGGGAGGTGAAASLTVGGAANASPGGGAAGSSSSTPTTTRLDAQSVIGYWWTGVTGGSNALNNPGAGGERGSDFFGRGRGGALSGTSGGGAGGYGGDGGAAGASGVSAAANSGAGGGGSTAANVGGSGGSGGVIIEWI